MKLLHIGVPTDVKQENETYMSDMQVYVTDPEASEFKYEYLRFDKDSWMAKEIQEQVHIAIEVDSIDEYLKKIDRVLMEPRQVSDNMKIAFVMKDNAVLELVEMS